MLICPTCGPQLSTNQCPAGHTYCDCCSIVICINPQEMLANDFNSFCPVCKLSDGKEETPRPPNSFFCPITHNLMRDPVVIEDGVSYEHDAIKKWLETNCTSPFTNEDVDEDVVIKNTNLKNVINLWLESHKKKHEDYD